MNESIIIKLPKVGDILLERSYRAKHINISIRPPAKIRVAVPVGINFEIAQRFAEQKENWLEKQINKFSRLKRPPIYEAYSHFAGEVLLQRRESIIKRVGYLAKRHGFSHNEIKIKLMKSRWSSCSSKNNININILIEQLPKRLQDYIILHELMHTKIKNHSKHFWNELSKIIEDLNGLRQELREEYIL